MATVLILQDSIPSKKSLIKTNNISLVDEETGIVSVLGDKSPSCLRIVWFYVFTYNKINFVLNSILSV